MISALEFCCCAGGMALGFRRAGIEFDLAVDRDDDACASYEHNLGHRPLQMDLRDFLRLLQGGWRPGHDLDLIVADPPCTPWSAAGKQKGLADPRDCLRPMIEIIRILRPRAFLLGNVPGLEYTTASDSLRETIGSLSYEGYCIDDVVLDASSFGVPQRRIRPFWFAHRGGGCITWPSATHGPPTRQLEIGAVALKPWVTCRQALSDLPVADLGKIRKLRPQPGTPGVGGGHPWSEPDEPARTICARAEGGHGGGDVLKVMRDGFPPSHADEPGRTVTTRASGGGNRMIIGDGGQALPEWPWDRPATTVCAENWIPQPGHCHVGVKGEARRDKKSYQGWHAIVLSERARARLQGFPDKLCGCNGGFPLHAVGLMQMQMEEGAFVLGRADWSISEVCGICFLPSRPWKFVGETKGSRSAQIGMAMPPPMAEVVARSIVQWFEQSTAHASTTHVHVDGDTTNDPHTRAQTF